MAFDVGDRARVYCQCLNDERRPADPTTLVLKVKDPADTVTTYTYAAVEIVRKSLGNFYKDVSLTSSGSWRFRFEATGAIVAAEEGQFLVQASAFA